MEELRQETSMKIGRVIGLSSVILGTFIGAGFIGGREVCEYFSKYGFFAVFMTIVAFVVFAIFMYICMVVGKKYSTNDNNACVLYNNHSNIAKYIILVSGLINVGSMIAGSYSVASVFGSKQVCVIIPFLVIVLCYFVVKNRYNALTKVNVIVVPIILVVIIVITSITCFNSNDIVVPIKNIFVTLFGGIGSVVIYVFFNMLLLGVLLIQIGKEYSYKELRFSAVISSFVISVLILLISLSITLSGNDVFNSSVPLLQECININTYFAKFFGICQLFGIFTTLISSAYLTSNILVDKVRNYKKCIIISLLVGLVVSILGFQNIVSYLYFLTGIMSIGFYVILFYDLLSKSFKRSNHKT